MVDTFPIVVMFSASLNYDKTSNPIEVISMSNKFTEAASMPSFRFASPLVLLITINGAC